MNPLRIQRISLIGSGRVAQQLAQRCVQCGLEIAEVYSRNEEHAIALAKKIQSKTCRQLADLETNSDLYLLAVSDDAIEEVAIALSQCLPATAFVAHTSGATKLQALDIFQNRGIFYPLQTFSSEQQVDFSTVPFCVTASDLNWQESLVVLANRLGAKAYLMSDEQRAYLHVAAVFANNFTNHCYHIAQQLTKEQAIPFELLRPLILATAQNIQSYSPKSRQTGPAIRGDQRTLNRHLDLLKDHPNWQTIYRMMSEQIKEENGKWKIEN